MESIAPAGIESWSSAWQRWSRAGNQSHLLVLKDGIPILGNQFFGESIAPAGIERIVKDIGPVPPARNQSHLLVLKASRGERAAAAAAGNQSHLLVLKAEGYFAGQAPDEGINRTNW